MSSVPNRDEFGHLTSNLNRTTEQLATVYGDLETLNANLQEAVDVKVGELERARVSSDTCRHSSRSRSSRGSAT